MPLLGFFVVVNKVSWMASAVSRDQSVCLHVVGWLADACLCVSQATCTLSGESYACNRLRMLDQEMVAALMRVCVYLQHTICV